MIISFGWTTPALLAGQKTVTRRDWSLKHVAQWRKRFRDAAARGSDTVTADAWNTSPRNTRHDPPPGHIAVIRLLLPPYAEAGYRTPAKDWHNEGFEYLATHDIRLNGLAARELWMRWQGSHEKLYVVRFEVMYLTPYGEELKARLP